MPGMFGNFSKRNVIFFTGLTIVMIVLYMAIVHLPHLARARIEGMLTDAGFRNAKVSSVSLRPTGLRVRDVALDSYGLDQITLIDADLNWIAFMTSGALTELRIKGAAISLDGSNLSLTAQKLMENLLDLPYYKISLSDITVDMATSFGALRVKLEANINSAADGRSENGKDRDIRAKITGEQYQLGFSSVWEGALKDDGQLELFSNVEDGRLNMGPLRISRFNGWVGVSVSGGGYKIQSQMGAGSASFMDVPLQDVSMVSEYTAEQSSALFRSGVSGLPDVLFTGDFLAKNKQQTFTALLKGNDLGTFLARAGESRKSGVKSIRDPLKKAGSFEAKAVFQPDRRFVGGPLPFTITALTGEKKSIDGNILIYPDTLDVRGSLETSNDMANAMQDYFKIPATNISQNFIRLDGTIKPLMGSIPVDNKPGDKKDAPVSAGAPQ